MHSPTIVLTLHILVGPEDAAADHLEELSIELSSDYLEEISTTLPTFIAINHPQNSLQNILAINWEKKEWWHSKTDIKIKRNKKWQIFAYIKEFLLVPTSKNQPFSSYDNYLMASSTNN